MRALMRMRAIRWIGAGVRLVWAVLLVVVAGLLDFLALLLENLPDTREEEERGDSVWHRKWWRDQELDPSNPLHKEMWGWWNGDKKDK